MEIRRWEIGQFLQFLKTRVILILNFTRPMRLHILSISLTAFATIASNPLSSLNTQIFLSQLLQQLQQDPFVPKYSDISLGTFAAIPTKTIPFQNTHISVATFVTTTKKALSFQTTKIFLFQCLHSISTLFILLSKTHFKCCV